MKKTLLMMLIVSACTLSVKSQTKGTNAVGLGFGSSGSETRWTSDDGTSNSNGKSLFVNADYSYFFKDNLKTGVFIRYHHGKSMSEYESFSLKYESREYGAGLVLDKYHRLFERFFATVGGSLDYRFQKSERNRTNIYSLSGGAGLSYFAGKHWAIETRLLSLNASILTNSLLQKDVNGESITNTESFSFSSAGQLADLGFNVRFLF